MMQLVPATAIHYPLLMQWVDSAEKTRLWAGPHFPFPLTESAFISECIASDVQSFVLVNNQAEMLAFGGFYSWLEKCHLCRLIVSPAHRGQGIIQMLLEQLIAEGKKQLAVTTASLIVMKDNPVALRAYQRFGFSITPLPESQRRDDCWYLTL